MAGTVLEFFKLSFVETGTGRVCYKPTSETQYIVLIKSGYLISQLPFSPEISSNKTAIVPSGVTRPPFSQLGLSETPGFFTARILSTRQAHRDAWMATQGDFGMSGVCPSPNRGMAFSLRGMAFCLGMPAGGWVGAYYRPSSIIIVLGSLWCRLW